MRKMHECSFRSETHGYLESGSTTSTFRSIQGLIRNRPLTSRESIKEVCLYTELENALVPVIAGMGFLGLFLNKLGP